MTLTTLDIENLLHDLKALTTVPEVLTNEEFREVYGDPCEHANGTHLDYAVNGDPHSVIWVFECHDCGLVL